MKKTKGFLQRISPNGFYIFPKGLLKALDGDACVALFLVALISRKEWFLSHGWPVPFFWKAESVENELSFSHKSQQRYIKKLVDKGWLTCERKGIPAKRLFTLNEERIEQDIPDIKISGEQYRSDLEELERHDMESRVDEMDTLQNGLSSQAKLSSTYRPNCPVPTGQNGRSNIICIKEPFKKNISKEQNKKTPALARVSVFSGGEIPIKFKDFAAAWIKKHRHISPQLHPRNVRDKSPSPKEIDDGAIAVMKMLKRHEDAAKALKWALEPSCFWHAQVRSLPALIAKTSKFDNFMAAYQRQNTTPNAQKTPSFARTYTPAQHSSARLLTELVEGIVGDHILTDRDRDDALAVAADFEKWHATRRDEIKKLFAVEFGHEGVGAVFAQYLAYLSHRFNGWQDARPVAAKIGGRAWNDWMNELWRSTNRDWR